MFERKIIQIIAFVILSGAAGYAQAQSFVRLLPDDTTLGAEENRELAAIKSLPTTEWVRLAEVDPEQLKKGGDVTFDLGEGRSLSLSGNDRVAASARDFVWSGEEKAANRSNAEAPANAVVTVDGNEVSATIRTSEELYSIEPLGGGAHVMIKVATDRFPPDHMGRWIRQRGEKRDMPGRELRKADRAVATIRVLVFFTPKAKAQISNMALFAKQAVNETNTAFANSRVNARVELADAQLVRYTETGSQKRDTARLAARRDGHMDGIHAIRDRMKADLVLLITTDRDACGWSQQVYANAASAFASNYFDCSIKNLSFAHEIGHLLGACHNVENSSGCPFSYAHGYRNEPQRKQSVMAYPCRTVKCVRQPQYSRPPDWGNARHANVVRLLNATAGRAAAFR